MSTLTPAERFERCLNVVCGAAIEGGFVNDPRDGGGATNHGVTLATLSHSRGHACTVDDIKALTLDEASAIYQSGYWAAVAGDALPAGLDLMAFDCAVNQGPGTAARMLQEAVGAGVDGHVGPGTLAAAAATGAGLAIHRMADLRMAAYREAAGWPVYGNGWSARVATVLRQAQAWAAQ